MWFGKKKVQAEQENPTVVDTAGTAEVEDEGIEIADAGIEIPESMTEVASDVFAVDGVGRDQASIEAPSEAVQDEPIEQPVSAEDGLEELSSASAWASDVDTEIDDAERPQAEQEEAEDTAEAVPDKPTAVAQGKDKEKKVEGPRDCSLYLLVEKVQPNLGEYLEDLGIHAKTIREDVENLKLDLMLEQGGARVLVLEQGVGRFTTTMARKDIQDLVGMCDGDTRKVTVFATSGILKGDINRRTVGRAAAGIDWQSFMGFVSVVKYLRGLGETYIEPDERVDETEMLPKLIEDDLLRLLPVVREASGEGEAEQPKPKGMEYFQTENLFMQVMEQQRKAGGEAASSEEEFGDDVIPPVAVSY